MLSPYIAYLLGLFTILLILIPFYVASMKFPSVANVWDTAFCNQLAGGADINRA